MKKSLTDLFQVFDEAKEKNARFIAVLVQTSALKKPELMIHHIEDAAVRKAYYYYMFREDLRCIKEKDVKILDYAYGHTLAEIEEKIYTSKEKKMNFGEAVEALKQGKKVAREGWNGKNMFLYYVKAASYPAMMPAIKGVFQDDMVPYGAYIAMKTAQGNVVPWLASQTDVLAEDYIIIEQENEK